MHMIFHVTQQINSKMHQSMCINSKMDRAHNRFSLHKDFGIEQSSQQFRSLRKVWAFV